MGPILDQSSVAFGRESGKNVAALEIDTWIKMERTIVEEELAPECQTVCILVIISAVIEIWSDINEDIKWGLFYSGESVSFYLWYMKMWSLSLALKHIYLFFKQFISFGFGQWTWA